MAFDFDILYVKGKTFLHEDVLSRQEFSKINKKIKKKIENHENVED